MPKYEPEVGQRLVQNGKEGVDYVCDLDELMNSLQASGIPVERLGAAIEAGRIAVTNYPMLSYKDVSRWLNEGAP